MRCDFLFGKTMREAFDDGIRRDAVPGDQQLRSTNNPLPTGDHWKVIGWVLDHRKRGDQSLARVPAMRRDFIRKAAEALGAGGFCMEIASMAARRFRDDHGLRMQRGKVYAFISLLPVVVSEEQKELIAEAGAIVDDQRAA